MKLGCSTLLYGLHSQDDALAGIKKAGYDAIELTSLENMGFHLWPERTDHAALRRKVAEMGLVIESIHNGGSAYVATPSGRYKELMDSAAELDVPAVACGSGGKSGDADDMKRAADVLTMWGEYGKSIGVKISIKPHVGSVVHNTPSCLEFIKLVDAKWVGFNVDPSHLWRAEPRWEAGEQSIPKLAPYIVTARIRDTLTHDKPIGPVETQVPGGGAMDLKACMDAFKKVPGLEHVTLEIVGTRTWPLDKIQEVVQASHDALRPLC